MIGVSSEGAGLDSVTRAYHEAGHAVIARVLGLPCGGATIEPDENSARHSIVADPWTVIERWAERGRYRERCVAFRGKIISLMAGAEAEAEFFVQCVGGDGDDRAQILEIIESGEAEIDPDAWRRYEIRLRTHTKHLTRRHRSRIIRVAAELIAHRRLEAHEVDALMA